MLLLQVFGIGIVAGMRTMMPLVMLSWPARLGVLHLENTHLAFLGAAWAPWVFSAAGIAELVADKLPFTPSRKTPPQFGARIVTGTFGGIALGLAGGSLPLGICGGAAGAIVGTLFWAWARGKMAEVYGKDMPAALTEDVAAIVLGLVASGLLY